MALKFSTLSNGNLSLNLLLWLGIFCYYNSYDLVLAQVIEDETLSTEVNTKNDRDFTVDAGEQRGKNLFHSFSEFSIPKNGSVLFNNSLSTENIITRVTGSSISHINGLIQSNGTANLFLINPNGIVFGENARLNIGGSFMGTTAESLVFKDGTEFSSKPNNSEPLLSVNVPLGLQFGSNPGEIANQANFSIPNSQDSTGQDRVKLGLTTAPNKTLAVLGGDITFDGGAVSASGGNIELGSVAGDSFIKLESATEGWKAGYDDVIKFKDVELNNLASVDASGEGGGSVNIQGQRVRVLNGSIVTSNTLGAANGKDLTIKGIEAIEVDGSDPTNLNLDPSFVVFEIFLPIPSRIMTTTFASGNGGDIQLATQRLFVRDGAKIQARTIAIPGNSSQQLGNGGDILIGANTSVEIDGTRSLLGIGENAPELLRNLFPISSTTGEFIDLNRAIILGQGSSIDSISSGNGHSGNIDITSDRVKIEDASSISNSPAPFSSGGGGDISITSTSLIEIAGSSEFNSPFVSIVTTNTFGEGKAGNVYLATDKLSLLNGGGVSAGTISFGDGGEIQINSRSIEIIGTSGDGMQRSELGSEAFSTGDAGDVIVKTENLTIAKQGRITVRGLNSGTPGNLTIDANLVELSDRAQITAENVAAFEGGNIRLDIEGSLTLEDGSTISAQAFNNANGGNLDLEVGFLIANPNQNNDILATAVGGDGGNINIEGNGIFGIQERKSRPPNFSNDIDASSKFGMDGIVALDIPSFQEFQSLLTRSPGFIDVNYLLKNNFCNLSRDSEYRVVGKNGIAFTIDDDLPVADSWSDWRFLDREQPDATAQVPVTEAKPRKLEMIQGWTSDRDGRIVLTADASVVTPQRSTSPHYDCSAINN